MPRPSDARAKAIATAERLFRCQGFAATGVAQIIAESGAPKGSFYFHFPGGKDQLAEEVVRSFATSGLHLIQQLAAATTDDAAAFARRLGQAVAAEMHGSGYQLGCVFQNLASERAPHDAGITEAISMGLKSWLDAIEGHFARCGVREPARAAMTLVAGLEGARTLARVLKSSAPFDALSETLKPTLMRA